MTFGERRKKVDTKLIQQDMESIESAFLADSQKLNKKRHELLIKKVKKLLPELGKAYEQGDTNEFKGILATISMPSHKEYSKAITRLINTSAQTGVLRAHEEIVKLKNHYSFSEDDTYVEVTSQYTNEVVFPPEVQSFLENYALQITAITEATVVEDIRKVLIDGFSAGLETAKLVQLIRECADKWLGEAHATTIARTEMGKMYNAGRLARYMSKENQGFVVALQYDSIIDTRTTKICRHLDGMIISIDSAATIAEYTPPNHFQCRAVWLPVTKFEDWEDNFTPTEKPEEGFNFTAPLPNLLRGQTQPLVKPTSS